MQGEHPKPLLSLVVPMLDEAPVVEELLSRVEPVFSGLEGGWEMIVVDDGSTDGTWELLREMHPSRPWLRGIRLGRSFGQHPATFAGLEAADGEIIAVMDADLQVYPEDMTAPVVAVQEGADLAFAMRDHVGEGFLRETVGVALNRFLARHSAGAPGKALSTFFAARAEIVRAALALKVAPPVTPFHLMLGGPRNVAWVRARNAVREKGRSKYGLRRLFNLTLDTFFGYTNLARKALLGAGVAAPLGAAAAWALALLVGWNALAVALYLAGACWAAVCLAALAFLARQLAVRRRQPASAPLYLVKETF